MTDPTRDPSADPTEHGLRSAEHPGLPRWVWISGLVVAVLVLAMLALMLLMGGEHGPSLHATRTHP